MTGSTAARLRLGFSAILLCGCSSAPLPDARAISPASALARHVKEEIPPLATFAMTDQRWQQDATGSDPDAPARSQILAARIFAFADSQFHHRPGQRTFAQSPFAERMSFEVAVRPAALDDSSDLLLELFLSAYRARYRDHALVFLGDATDLSCLSEMRAFEAVLQTAGIRSLYPVTSNHDGFYAGNFTARRDLDGDLRLTDMPRDWTRACAVPGSRADRRLTKGRAVDRLYALLPGAEPWATEMARGAGGPTDYREAYLYYVRRLSGGRPDAPPVYGVFLDTVDYRGFDFESSRGAGSTGAVSRQQLGFLDRAMFQAAQPLRATGRPVTFILFGHHPFHAMEPATAARLRAFLRRHRDIVAYVAAHTHESMERGIELDPTAARGDQRARPRIPELIVGSTTDAPQAARVIDVAVDPVSGERSVHTRRLVLDSEAMCAHIAPMAADTTGYTGYRIVRDGTPALSISTIEKLLFVTGLADLARKRALQVVGALLMENELVRSWARLYRDAPVSLTDPQRDALDDILARRYAGGERAADLHPYLQGQMRDARASEPDDAGYDPVIAPILASAERGVHRFASSHRLLAKLAPLRTQSPEARRYFTCHAVYAARAESKRAHQRDNVLYIR